MQNNYHFLKLLSPILEEKLRGAVISECYTQEKNECIIRFEINTKSFFIRTSLSPAFSCLSFPNDFNRARKNSVDLFPLIIGQKIVSVTQTPYDRSFAIALSDDLLLLFKMHSNRANLVLFQHTTVVDIFRKKLKQDSELTPTALAREVNWRYENFKLHEGRPQNLFFTFGKVTWKYLTDTGFYNKSTDEQWLSIESLFCVLETPDYFITEVDGHLTFSLLKVGSIRREFRDPIIALNEYYQGYALRSVFESERTSLQTRIRKRIQSAQNFATKATDRLNALKTDNNFKVWADVLMANLHAIKQGAERVVLPDFYHDNTFLEIKLKRTLSPQKNAELFYNKSKKQQVEIEHLTQSLKEKETEWNEASQALEKVAIITDLKTLRGVGQQYEWSSPDDDEAPLPFHEVAYKGFRILIGKNAQSNDRMLQRYSHKEDLWLHVKDVSGSHVLIKYQSGKPFPKDVIERAAELTAYNSKRKTESLCPVVVTPRKFVRKRKGDPAGAVVVERERVIMVEPKL
ncbi:MAG: NFACT RNA binding domain-containing protein [Chryseolinea sp.]